MACCTKKMACIGCTAFVLILGITCAVLGAKGYFGFSDPCVGVESFEITDISLEQDSEGSSSSLISLFDTFTGGLASGIMPTQVTMTLQLVLEVNNTNPYKLELEQQEQGTIAIPLDDEDGSNTTNTEEGDEATTRNAADNNEDRVVVGTWEIPATTLEKRARNEVPITLTTSIDLLADDTLGLGFKIGTGGKVAFRIDGQVRGSGWVPGFTGTTSLWCLAELEDILNSAGEKATIKCRHSTNVLQIYKRDEEFAIDESMWDDEEDPSCYV